MLRKCRINDCRHEISVSLFFSSVNKVKESLFFYEKKRTKPSILISCGFYCVVGFCRGCRRLLQVADHPQVCLGALSPFETSACDVRCEFLSVEIRIGTTFCNVLSAIWTATFDLTESFSSAFYLWPSFQWPTDQLFMKLTLWSAALGLNPST